MTAVALPLDRRALLGGLGAIALARPALALASNYPRALANVLVSEGGNDDDKRDPGGRTSRGIIQREWNAWRRTRPGLPADVWRAPQAEIEAIYRARYWNVMRADALPAGLDYCLFDYAVNSGPGRAGKVLHLALKLSGGDWHVTDAVLAAVGKADATSLIGALCDERLAFLRRLSTFRRFGGGWTARVRSVRSISLRMAGIEGLFDAPDAPAFGPGKAYEVDL